MDKGQLRLQETQGTCGLAALRNSFIYSHLVTVSERRLRKKAQEIYSSDGKKERISKDGVGPWGIAKLINEELADLTDCDLKVFMTKNGTVDQLEYFLKLGMSPIIHRAFHEGDKTGHYESVLKVYEDNLLLYNPAREVSTSGFHVKSKKYFYDKWWDFKGERWFLAHYPASEKLPRKEFNGKYM